MIENYLSETSKIIEKRLKSYYENKKNAHSLIKKSILYSLLAGGKRIRPTLMFLFYELSGKPKEDIIDAAASIEMIHTYSLIHDDLPAMDNDELRRGKPTNHIVFGEAMAILAGDGLLTDAFNIISSMKKIDEKLKTKAIEILSERAGSSGMVSGQVADMLSEDTKEKNKSKLSKMISYIHKHKTADMISAACEIGRILSGKKDIDLARKFGTLIGTTFQIVDDILDVTQTPEKLGKNPSDQKNKKLTYVTIFGLEESRKIANNKLKEALSILKKIDGKKDKKDLIEELSNLIVRRDK